MKDLEPTIQIVSDIVWNLRELSPLVEDKYFHYYVEIDTMSGGKPVAEIGSRIQTWPEYISNRYWFLMLQEILPLNWTLFVVQPGER